MVWVKNIYIKYKEKKEKKRRKKLMVALVLFQQRVHPILPYGIMGLNALIAGLLCILLPETRHQPTRETTKQKEVN